MAVIMYNKINHGFVCRVEVTRSCNKSKLIFRLWNIIEGVHLPSINLVLPGIQRTTSGTGTDFIQPFKLIYSFSNVWFKKIPLPPPIVLGFYPPPPTPFPLEFPYLTLGKENVQLCSLSEKECQLPIR